MVFSCTKCRNGEGSRDCTLLKDCGDVSLVCGTDFAFLASSLKFGVLALTLPLWTLLSEEDRPRVSTDADEGWLGSRSPKNNLGDHADFSGFGGSERADRFFRSTDEEVFRRGSEGGGGGALGVINLSAGFIVLTSPLVIELIDALRYRRG